MKFALRYLIFLYILFPPNILAETFSFAISDSNPPYTYAENGKVTGIIPETLNLIFNYLPNDHVTISTFPWARAQLEVKNNRQDGLLTYPSLKRKSYASFTRSPVLFMDYGFLIYHKENQNRTIIEDAKSFNDLQNLSVIVQTGVGWEEDNIPQYIDRKKVGSIEAMIHYLLKRQYGDFLIMPPEQAKYFAKKFGYSDKLKYKKVSFIANSNTPFHLGVRETHKKGKNLLTNIEIILKRDDFKLALNNILNNHR